MSDDRTDDPPLYTVEREQANGLVQRWIDQRLSHEDEVILAGIIDARVHTILAKIHIPESINVPHEDWVSIGVCAALECAPRWRVEYGDFWTFSYARIRGAILDHIRFVDPLPRSMRVTLGVVNKSRRKIAKQAGEDASAAAVAADTGLDVDDVREAIEAGHARERISLDRIVTDDSEQNLLAVLPVSDHVLDRGVLYMEFGRALATLPERTATILYDIYIRDMPQTDVAIRHSVTAARISQIRQDGMNKVRMVLTQSGSPLAHALT